MKTKQTDAAVQPTKGKVKKGIRIYVKLWAFFLFVDVLFLFTLYSGFRFGLNVMNAADPSVAIANFNRFSIVLVLVVAAVILVCAFDILSSLRKGFKNLVQITHQLSLGNIDVAIPAYKADEFGTVLAEYENLIDATREQAALADSASSGDLTVRIKARSNHDVLGSALETMIERNACALSDIKEIAVQVSSSASDIASAGDALSQGAAEQASALEEITVSISDLALKTQQNAELSNTADTLIKDTMERVENGGKQMNELLDAMRAINASSADISKIIRVIEDISSQTNILALNAAVEASRAGAAGKGFAVVADEVRTLAHKTSEAAAQTSKLIESSIETVNTGSAIATETGKAFAEITSSVRQNGEIADRIAEASSAQAAAITQINQAIDQVSAVVQTNSATSEECAASANGLSDQASTVRDLLSVYKLDADMIREIKERKADKSAEDAASADADADTEAHDASGAPKKLLSRSKRKKPEASSEPSQVMVFKG